MARESYPKKSQSLRVACHVGHGNAHSVWPLDARALDPRPTPSRGQALREDDGQGSWHSPALATA